MVALVRHTVAFERRILAVLDDRHPEHARVLHGAPQQQRRRHRAPIVGNGAFNGTTMSRANNYAAPAGCSTATPTASPDIVYRITARTNLSHWKNYSIYLSTLSPTIVNIKFGIVNHATQSRVVSLANE